MSNPIKRCWKIATQERILWRKRKPETDEVRLQRCDNTSRSDTKITIFSLALENFEKITLDVTKLLSCFNLLTKLLIILIYLFILIYSFWHNLLKMLIELNMCGSRWRANWSSNTLKAFFYQTEIIFSLIIFRIFWSMLFQTP